MKVNVKALSRKHALAKDAYDKAYKEYKALADLADDKRSDEQVKRMAALEKDMDDNLEPALEAAASELATAVRDARYEALMSTPSNLAIRPGARFTSHDPDPAGMGGFHSLAHFADAVRARQTGSSMIGGGELAAAPSSYLVNSGSAGEGWAVPPEFVKEIWEIAFDPASVMGYFRPNPTASNTVILAKDETTPWGATGVQAYWRAEASTLTPSKLQLLGSEIKLNEIYAFCAATSELLADAPMLQDRLTNKAGLAIRYKVLDAIINGDGVGKPLGFMNSGYAGLIAQAKESGQTAATIVLANLLKMRTRMLPESLARSIWFGNSEIEPQLVQLQIGSMPVFAMIGTGAQDAPGMRVLGRPLEYIWQASTVGTQNDIMLLDPAGYYLATKEGGGVDFASSIHLYFDVNMTAFRWLFRVGGQPILSQPVSPPSGRGTLTKSHFVTLATRS